MLHPEFPLNITERYGDKNKMKASLTYLEMRAKALTRVHGRSFVRDCLQMITVNRILLKESEEIFVVIDGQEHFLA